ALGRHQVQIPMADQGDVTLAQAADQIFGAAPFAQSALHGITPQLSIAPEVAKLSLKNKNASPEAKRCGYAIVGFRRRGKISRPGPALRRRGTPWYRCRRQ